MRLLVPSTLAFSLALALACGGGGTSAPSTPATPASPSGTATPEATPPAPPPPPAPTAAAPAATPAPAPKGPFLCCDNERAGRVLDAYLGLQAALATSDDRKAGGELSALQGKIDGALDKGNLDEESRKLLTTMRPEVHSALITKDMKARRDHFKKISASMIPFVKKHEGGNRKIAEAWCPMVEAGWIQEGTTIANPYDPSMPTCGSWK